MRIRASRKKIWYAVAAGAAGMMALLCILGYFGYKHMHNKELDLIEKYETEITELEISASSKKVGYTLREEIDKGTLISESMLQKVYLSEGANAADLIQLEDLEKNGELVYRAKTQLNANTLVSKALFYEDENISDDVREGEYSFIEIPSNVLQDSYVDIRIQFPTGDDFVVLSKKKVKSIFGVTMQMNVAEAEILTLSSAVVDAYIEGAKIYAIPYVDEHMQIGSTLTYPVKENVRELINSSPNIINIAKYYLEQENRQRLENNLLSISQEQKSLVDTGENATSSKVQSAEDQRSQEEKLNELNQQAEQQQSLIGGE